mgnify:FL=1
MRGEVQPPLTLWSHALAAFLFGVLALVQLRQRDGGLPRITLIVALGATALWALAAAGIDARDPITRLAEGARNLAWLGFIYVLARREPADAGGRWLTAVYIACALTFVIATGLAIAEATAAPGDKAAIGDARVAFRMLGSVTALLLIYRMQARLSAAGRGGIRAAALAMALMFVIDTVINLALWTSTGISDGLIAARGLALIAFAPLFGLAVQRNGEWTLQLSRNVAFLAISLLVAGVYVVVIGLAISLIGQLGGNHIRLAQTAFVFGTAAALLTVVSTPWLRAWAKVLVAKHLFTHRYDYRAEWLRFTETLGTPGDSAAPLGIRVVKAVADVTDSPAGLLLLARDGGLERGAGWNWPEDDADPAGGDAALHRHLAATQRIVALDAVRDGTAPAEERAAAPSWLVERDHVWAIVPLCHFDQLTGAIVLARPPLDRALDWEDFDLLGVAGRQVASYLAEERAHDALADARRFDEFNRRFAFIMHDLKNLVSQLTLLARNAERHADNPAFRADMVETLRDSAQRMNNLLARLSQHHGGRGEALREVSLRRLAERIAAARRAQHVILVTGAPEVNALADATALETLLGHLVQNAIEASAADAPVTLNLVDLPATRQVAVEVIDTGRGMSPAFMRDRLFKPFVSGKPGGFGLGAFEARQLAETMGGSVTVESREREGTRFRVTLRSAAAMEQAA